MLHSNSVSSMVVIEWGTSFVMMTTLPRGMSECQVELVKMPYKLICRDTSFVLSGYQ
jgi:hypothetical protein